MDVIRRNTDYAMRLVVSLVENYGGESISVSELSKQEDVSYDLACKLLQKLKAAGFVKSCMGPKGGFLLAKEPGKISMLDIVAAIQGPVIMNRCLNAGRICPRQPRCAVSRELMKMQKYIENYLGDIKLDKLLERGGCDCGGK
ncbi:MAG: Rrf2 family transcriptional regulator [Anaerohalosphaeraceae bacterium]|nr:Rrf2 family transcriptional regulator [Anaerohalosphaeraceae bacterium]